MVYSNEYWGYTYYMYNANPWKLRPRPLRGQNWSNERPWHFTSRKLIDVICSLSETQKNVPIVPPTGPKYPIRNCPRPRSAQLLNSYFSQQWQDIRTAARTSWIHHLHQMQTGTFRRLGDSGEIQFRTSLACLHLIERINSAYSTKMRTRRQRLQMNAHLYLVPWATSLKIDGRSWGKSSENLTGHLGTW